MITRKELIKKYMGFFKKNGHKEIPSTSLVSSNDPTTLFISAGMQPLVPYLLGQKHPLGKRIVDVQKCVRTTDIDEVGDEVHHTFFEMLGNWSLGDYWKKEAIEMSFEFLTKTLNIDKNKLAVSCFKGDKDASRDDVSAKTWESLGIPKERIVFLGKKDNWWGPAGKTGPSGPDTEMFYWSSKTKPPKKFNPEDKRWVEIWNDVFMEYNKNEKGTFEPLKQKNVDTGMGVERTLAALNGIQDNYMTEVWKPTIQGIEKLSKKKYGNDKETTKTMRIIADHIKASVFIISDGVSPGNSQQGYVLRRLIRRAVRHGKEIGIKYFTSKIAETVFEIYEDYNELKKNKNKILKTLEEEENKFDKTLEKGLRMFSKISKNKNKLLGKDAFFLYQSYGFPLELTEELVRENKIKIDYKSFEKEFEKHRDLSKKSSSGKFSSGLADSSKETTRLHTATHLLNESLRKILGKEVKQKGSNITSERLRFDFNFPRKMEEEEIKKVEDLVNKKISEKLLVKSEEMPLKKALHSGAQAEFGAKYPEIVSVYTIGDFSKEICTGPHVKNTEEIGKFKIVKEESSSAGVRRIKAVVE